MFRIVASALAMTQRNHIGCHSSGARWMANGYPVIVGESPHKAFLITTDGTRVAPILQHKKTLLCGKGVWQSQLARFSARLPQAFLGTLRFCSGIKKALDSLAQPDVSISSNSPCFIRGSSFFNMVPIIVSIVSTSLVSMLRIVGFLTRTKFLGVSLVSLVGIPSILFHVIFSIFVRVSLHFGFARSLGFFLRSIFAERHRDPLYHKVSGAGPLLGDKLQRVLQHPAVPAHPQMNGTNYNILRPSF